MTRLRRCLALGCALAAALLVGRAPAGDAPALNQFEDLADYARPRVAKIYGGALGAEKGYGSGVIVSADGQIVTVVSLLLEGRLRVVLDDGRSFPADIIRRDDRRMLALLKIDATDLPAFELGRSDELLPGDWVLAAANAFKVADGPEPVSVSAGVLSGRAPLIARYRAQDLPFRGEVWLTDVLTSTPGSAGGALLDTTGRLVGVIGRTALSLKTNTWINYAMPAEEVRAFLRGDAEPPTATTQSAANADDLGIRLFDVGGRSRPAYVERVRPGSPAAAAGVRPNDLILSIADQNVTTCEDFRRAAQSIAPGRVVLMVKRGDKVLMIEATLGGAP